MRQVKKGILLGVSIGVIGAVLGLSAPGIWLETRAGLSWLFSVRGPVAAPDDIAIVAINGQTGANLGLNSAPREWPRSIHGQLVDRLVDAGASTIVFDVFFQSEKNIADDQQFADSIQRADRVVLVEKLTGKRQPITDAQGLHVGSVWLEELVPPLAMYEQSARGLAPFPLPKIDAAVYEFWSFKDSVGDAPTMPALTLQIKNQPQMLSWFERTAQPLPATFTGLFRALADSQSAPQTQQLSRQLRRLFLNTPALAGDLAKALENDYQASVISLDTYQSVAALLSVYAGQPHYFINFYGPPGSITTIPYHAIIKGGDPNISTAELDLRGKTVFVGFSDLYDPGQPDRFYTVFTSDDGVDLSGVEIAATAFANLQQREPLATLSITKQLLLLMGFGASCGMLLYLLPATWGVSLSISLAVIYAIAAQTLFNRAHIWPPMAVPLLVQLPLAVFLGLLGQYIFERRRGDRISSAIQYYLPEKVARELTENSLTLDDSNKVVYSTCLATDMAGFSTIAETLSPAELALFLNDYFEILSRSLKKYEVDVTEFRADAIMCAWTDDDTRQSKRLKAILAALDALQAIDEFRISHPDFSSGLRVGLEAGNVFIGHAGGGGHFVYSIVGDCANTASRVEGLNKQLGTQLLATQAVIDGLEDRLLFRRLGNFVFVGKNEGLAVVEILSEAETASAAQKTMCERFASALAVFHSGNWQAAIDELEKFVADYAEDGPGRYFLRLARRHQTEQTEPVLANLIRLESK